MPRHSTPLTEEKLSVKESLTHFLAENGISAIDILKLEEWLTFSGEGAYNHIEFIRTIDMLKENSHIPDELIVGKLNSLFTRTAKKWFKMENAFESAIFNAEKDKPLTWFFRKKDRLSALHPDVSDTMINMKILIKCKGVLENAIKCRFVETFSTEKYINAREDIIIRKRSSTAWTRNPMESIIIQKTSKEDRRPERPIFKLHKCRSTSN
ncbi:hypothetical protein O181_007340 [Austropuccinia psidii MF-1]|uniref:Uncharacterized protein n=1 Tax=Austropuccinia psidii MF-1 TaxID=1389203 RepID=A0A9Q3BMR2_9BASI|nr:hypothetical protein [Austropuccinia psidii MF-1]